MNELNPRPPIPHAAFALPWDDRNAPDPVTAIESARRSLGDTFSLESAGTRYVFVFGPAALQAFYDLPESVASKGLADYRMLLRKLPAQLFDGRRTFAHDLFGASDVTGYLPNLDAAITAACDELALTSPDVKGVAPQPRFEVFEFARALGHRIGISSWFGPDAPYATLVELLDQLDGADAFVHPDAMVGHTMDRELGALDAVVAIVERLLGDDGRAPSFLDVVAQRWDDTSGADRAKGVAYDLVLLHIATMTNLFAAMGWSIAYAALHRTDGDDLDRLALEAIRLGQRSLISREVLRDFEFDAGDTIVALHRGDVLATMAPVTNRALPDGDEYVPERWAGSDLRSDVSVVTFGHGPHRCPAQRFSTQAITRTVRALTSRYELVARFTTVEPLPRQIGGVARAAAPCWIECVPLSAPVR